MITSPMDASHVALNQGTNVANCSRLVVGLLGNAYSQRGSGPLADLC